MDKNKALKDLALDSQLTARSFHANVVSDVQLAFGKFNVIRTGRDIKEMVDTRINLSESDPDGANALHDSEIHILNVLKEGVRAKDSYSLSMFQLNVLLGHKESSE